MDHDSMPGMSHTDPHTSATISNVERHALSGTDLEPNSTHAEMLMFSKRGWMLMLHGEAFLNEVQQSGTRGQDKLFSTNWLMPMAQRKLGSGGTLTLRGMLSLEPATVSKRRYPELFQQGETAYGKPIVDGQHPHDFFMEIAAMYDHRVGENTLLSVYVAPVGDPTLGPPAYPHRASASEDPLAPLGHHLEDSTHIADEVVTAGLTYKSVRIEASGFHGREPDELRWNVDHGGIDSWATRVSWNVGANWALQYSVGHLHSPEALNPAEDVRRMTASATYNRPLGAGRWSALLLWGRNQSLQDRSVGNAYLVESTLQVAKNSGWMRIENVDRTNQLLLGDNFQPPTFIERYFARVQAYTAGYDRELTRVDHLSVAVGGQLTFYGVPESLRPNYGDHPVGAVLFLRLRAQ